MAKLGDKLYGLKVIIADIVDDYIVGLDFMRRYHYKIDVEYGVLKCYQKKYPWRAEYMEKYSVQG